MSEAPFIKQTIKSFFTPEVTCPFCGSNSVDDIDDYIDDETIGEGVQMKFRCYDCRKIFYIVPGDYSLRKEEFRSVLEIRDSKKKIIYKK
jgi:transposase-like protein